MSSFFFIYILLTMLVVLSNVIIVTQHYILTQHYLSSWSSQRTIPRDGNGAGMGRATPTPFQSRLYIFFPSPSQTWGGASWCPLCPFTKELIIPSPSQMCFWESCFYRTWVSEISTNTIWVLIFKLQRTSFKMIHTLMTPTLCCLLIHI